MAKISYADTAILTNNDGSVSVTLKTIIKDDQVENFISQIHLIESSESCEIVLNYNSKIGNCSNLASINFCTYGMQGDTFAISGMIGAGYSIFPSDIELNGFIHNATCYIEQFPITQLYLKSYIAN